MATVYRCEVAEPVHPIAVVGVGTMGLELVRALREGRIEVHAFDIDPQATGRAAALGALVPETAGEAAAACGVVFVSLPSEAASDAALFGPGGVLEGASEGTVVVETSTISPAAAKQAARRFERAGVSLLDGPVTGRPPQMTMFVGGDAEALARASTALERVASAVHHMGPTGCGAAAKLSSQLSMLLNLVTAIEAIRLAPEEIAPGALIEALQTGWGASKALELVDGDVLAGRAPDDGSPLAQLLKDIDLIDALWGRDDVPVWRDAAQLFRAAAEAFGDDADFRVVAQLLGRSDR
jgi:3-hydroxyisobutyrate dehydrogenase-like beta-hydroxyacid dehydrogenase